MDEGHHCTFGPWSRVLVDEPHPAFAQLPQRRVDIFHSERNVMQPGAARADELRDRRIRRRRLEHLEGRLPGFEERRPNTLRRNVFRRLDVQTQHVLEERKGSLQIAHRDPDVVQDGFHFRALERISDAAVYGSSSLFAMRSTSASN